MEKVQNAEGVEERVEKKVRSNRLHRSLNMDIRRLTARDYGGVAPLEEQWMDWGTHRKRQWITNHKGDIEGAVPAARRGRGGTEGH